MKKKLIWLILSCIMVLSLVLASCGPAVTEEEEEAVTEEEEEVVAEGPQRGGQVNLAYTGGEATYLDPVLDRYIGADPSWQAIYDQVIASDVDFEPQAGLSLATSWEFPDPLTLVFYLRRGVKFHDGTAFDAEAVKFNIDRLLDPEVASTHAAGSDSVESVEVVDKYTVKVHLKNPWGSALSFISDRGWVMNSPTAVEKWGEDYGIGTNTVGTGPFKVKEHVSGSHTEYVRNEDYWMEDANGIQLPYLDGFTALFISDDAVRSAALEVGDIDLAILPLKDVGKFEADPNIGVFKFAGSAIGGLLHFNVLLPPVDNVYARKAMAYAINPEEINEAIYFGRYDIAKGSMTAPGSWGYFTDIPRPYYDPEKAREYLELAGVPEGFKVEVITYSSVAPALEMIQAQLAEIGIEVEMNVMEGGAMVMKMWDDDDAPAMWTGWSRYPEPDRIASLLYKSDGYYNAGNPPDPEMDALIEQGKTNPNIEERKKIYRQIDEIILDEVRFLPLLYTNAFLGYWNHVGGVEISYDWSGYYHLKYLWRKQ